MFEWSSPVMYCAFSDPMIDKPVAAPSWYVALSTPPTTPACCDGAAAMAALLTVMKTSAVPVQSSRVGKVSR